MLKLTVNICISSDSDDVGANRLTIALDLDKGDECFIKICPMNEVRVNVSKSGRHREGSARDSESDAQSLLIEKNDAVSGGRRNLEPARGLFHDETGNIAVLENTKTVCDNIVNVNPQHVGRLLKYGSHRIRDQCQMLKFPSFLVCLP